MISKKTLLSLVTPVILSIAGCQAQSKYVNPQELKRWNAVQEFYPKYIEQILIILSEGIKYKEEKPDFWSSPRITFMQESEDCDGKAIAGAYLAEKLGYPPKIILINTGGILPEDQHALTLLEEKREDKNFYGAIDERMIIIPVCNSLDRLVYEINLQRFSNQQPYLSYKVYDLNKMNPKWRTTDSNLKPHSEKYTGAFGFKKIDLEKIKDY